MEVLENPNGIKIYNVSVGKTLPQWLSEKKKRALRKDEEYQRRIELIQDFEFTTASQRIRSSRNQEYIIATGTYPPSVRAFELSQLTLKFERNLESEIVQFDILSEGYEKLVFLKMDRSVEFHTQAGSYYKIRVPKHGRDMMYNQTTCDLVIVGACNQIWRFNLEQGQFFAPFSSDLTGINVCDINPVHQLYVFGGENGVIECWDPRSKKAVGNRNIGDLAVIREAVDNLEVEISSIKFDSDGITLAVGTNTGQCLLYDMRAPDPLIIKDHQYGYPIKQVSFHKEKKILSCDTKIVKIWDQKTGKVEASIEPPTNINDMCLFPDSGLIIMACEQPKMLSYFIPYLGAAPKWCRFLDSLTEELEEDKQKIYDDFKFITKEELHSLGLNNLIGSQYLKPYMHGFFIDVKLYTKLRSAVEPLEYEEYKKQKIQEKLEKQSETRIGVKKKLPKVNARMAAKMNKSGIQIDERFKEFYENPDFQIDEENEKYKLHHYKEKNLSQEEIDEHFEPVELENPDISQESESSESEEEQEIQETTEKKKQKKKKKKKLQLYELRPGHDLSQPINPSEKKLSFDQRIKKMQNEQIKASRNAVGGMELTFTSQTDKNIKSKMEEKREEWNARFSSRRGIQELHLPNSDKKKKHFRK